MKQESKWKTNEIGQAIQVLEWLTELSGNDAINQNNNCC